MTDVFISYKREEREEARRLAEALTAQGYSVWWDAEILPGEQYRAVTLRILETCHAVIVIWSPRSTSSNWVLDEAQRALDRGVLVPVHLEPIGSYPLGFGQVHAHNLVDWSGDSGDAKFKPVLAAIKRLAPQAAPPPPPPPPEPAREDRAEVELWRGIQGSTNVADFETYLSRYGESGLFADLAKERVAQLQVRRFVPPPPPPPSLQQAFTRWELGFVAAVVFVAGFVIWPFANILGRSEVVIVGADYSMMFWPIYWQNVFILTPALTALAWGFDRAVAWCTTRGSFYRVLPTAITSVLLITLLISVIAGTDDMGQVAAAEWAHLYLWIAAAWGAALYARKMTPRFKQALQSIGLFKS